MRFDAQLWHGALHGGPGPDVDDGTMKYARDARLGGIDAARGYCQAAHIEVGRRKSKLSSQLISWIDSADQGVTSAQHLTGGIEIADSDRLANPGTADGLSVQSDRR